MPPPGLGRKAALLLRKLAMLGWKGAMDASVAGIRVRAHLHDNVTERKFIFMPKRCDPDEIQRVRDGLADGAFIDIGAHAGVYTLSAAQAINDLGLGTRVVAVEPNPTMVRRLETNLELNGWSSLVTVVNHALSDTEGEAMLALCAANLSESQLEDQSVGRSAASVPVRIETLAGLLDRLGIDRVGVIKIDVEAHEDRVLVPFFDNAPEHRWPRAIIIEDSADKWRADLLGRLDAAGYRLAARHRKNIIFERD